MVEKVNANLMLSSIARDISLPIILKLPVGSHILFNHYVNCRLPTTCFCACYGNFAVVYSFHFWRCCFERLFIFVDDNTILRNLILTSRYVHTPEDEVLLEKRIETWNIYSNKMLHQYFDEVFTLIANLRFITTFTCYIKPFVRI